MQFLKQAVPQAQAWLIPEKERNRGTDTHIQKLGWARPWACGSPGVRVRTYSNPILGVGGACGPPGVSPVTCVGVHTQITAKRAGS